MDIENHEVRPEITQKLFDLVGELYENNDVGLYEGCTHLVKLLAAAADQMEKPRWPLALMILGAPGPGQDHDAIALIRKTVEDSQAAKA